MLHTRDSINDRIVVKVDGLRLPVPRPVTARIAAGFRALTRDPAEGTRVA